MTNSDPADEAATRDWLVDDFDYHLPSALIAQEPLADRAASRLLVVHPGAADFPDASIHEIGCWLRPGDLLVANDSRVIPARLHARKEETGGRAELLLLRRDADGAWAALARPVRSLRPGTRLRVEPIAGSDAPAGMLEVVAKGEGGQVRVRFLEPVEPCLADYGETPLPPYITTRLGDPERYQTVYAAREGSAAAPTAGLHFTPELIDDLRARGIGWATVTLHVGLDTFRPVMVERVAEHQIHREWCEAPDATAAAIAATKATGGRVIAIGTTAARTLETLGRAWDPERPRGLIAETDLFITPGYRWSLVDGLLTNFHLPRSTLLMMVSALAGADTIRRAYAVAIERGYRFFSFGDAMLIFPGRR
ncbi:MAG: tRNA preQ1(34) S-adenosylmethionine ribosyltransferase-isomerase QueA [Thermomicrobiales bacterium]|nr:tRNA preQ1(34) S-adenosylmethionine ribosyltransferase-isomerase QueA [Thermomicrobiales bacterium]